MRAPQLRPKIEREHRVGDGHAAHRCGDSGHAIRRAEPLDTLHRFAATEFQTGAARGAQIEHRGARTGIEQETERFCVPTDGDLYPDHSGAVAERNFRSCPARVSEESQGQGYKGKFGDAAHAAL